MTRERQERVDKTVRKIVSRLIAAFLTLSLLLSLSPCLCVIDAKASNGKRFTILHTNDEHSDLIPYDLASEFPRHPTIGGFSRIARLIKDIKKEKKAQGEPVLTLSAGDYDQGTLFAWLGISHASELSLFSSVGYDAVAIGNHEFDLGPRYLAMYLTRAASLGVKIPLLSANIEFSEEDPADDDLEALFSETDFKGTKLAIQRYTIKTLSNGLKVGIFGLLGMEAEAVAPAASPVSFGNIKGNPTDPVGFINRVDVASKMVRELRSKGADVIVALSHSGTREERLLAQFVNGIDVIVGGHSHDLVYPPEVINNTIIVQSGSYTKNLGKLELEYSGGKLAVRDAKAIRIDSSIPTDPATDTKINGYLAAINAAVGRDVLAPFAETSFKNGPGFDLSDTPAWSETNLGDLVVDSYRHIINRINPVEPVQMAFEGSGNIRSSIVKGSTGKFSFYDLYRAIPLGGSPFSPLPGYPLVSFYLYGSEIKGVLEQILELGQNDFFVQVSGMTYKYNPMGEEGKRVMRIKTGEEYMAGKALDPKRLYKIATNYYTASFLKLFNVAPRGKDGRIVNLPTCLVDSDPATPGIQELKCWQALASYVQSMKDTDGNGLPNVLDIYRAPQGRITQLAWYLPEGCTAGGFETWVLVQNPNNKDATVKITYMTAEGKKEKQEFILPANSRTSIDVGGDVPSNWQVSTKVEASLPVVAERAMYWNNRASGHDSIGAPTLF